jgi:hypothetical protein
MQKPQDKTFELEASGYILRFSVAPNGWCRLSLINNQRVEDLGADSDQIVTERLISGLQDKIKRKIVGEITGIPVQWVLSLNEKHFTIYAGDDQKGRHLFFQDANAKLVASFVLSLEDRKQWLEKLIQFRKSI